MKLEKLWTQKHTHKRTHKNYRDC